MSIYIYIFTMALTTYLIRMLPLTLLRKPIKSRFIRSFLHYVPYACLTAMTFPSILSSTEQMLSGAAAFLLAVLLALKGKSLLIVSLGSSAAVLITAAVAMALSCLFAWAPVLNTVSPGVAIVVCTVAAAAFCAWKFPIKEEKEA